MNRYRPKPVMTRPSHYYRHKRNLTGEEMWEINSNIFEEGDTYSITIHSDGENVFRNGRLYESYPIKLIYQCNGIFVSKPNKKNDLYWFQFEGRPYTQHFDSAYIYWVCDGKRLWNEVCTFNPKGLTKAKQTFVAPVEDGYDEEALF